MSRAMCYWKRQEDSPIALLRIVAMLLLAPLLRPWFGDDSREAEREES